MNHSYRLELKQDTQTLFQSAWKLFRGHILRYALVLLLPAVAALLVLPFDKEIVRLASTSWRIPFWWHYAGELSRYGAYERSTLVMIAILLIAGVYADRHDWRRAALALFMACLCAGLLVNAIKTVTGRPRPNSGVEKDGFTGLTFDSDFHSFPSAHATTAMATAAVVAILLPGAAGPVILLELAVSASRIYVKGHYPSDVIVGAAIGLFFGFLFGAATRQMNLNRESAMKSPAGS